MFEAVEGMRQEHAEIEQRLSLPETHADQRLAKQLNQRYAELTAVVTTWQDWLQLGDDIEAARELGADDPAFAQEAEELAHAARGGLGAPAPPAGAARRRRRQGRAAGDQVGGGRRGVGAVRRRPAADVLPLRRDPGLERGDPRRQRVRPRWLQVRHRGGQGARHGGARPGAVRPAQVRGRRAPRPAGAGHRVAGARAHLGGRGARLARGRAGRRDDRRQRPAHRRLPQQRTRWPERQHHRLGRAHHARAHRHRGELPEREEPAAEQGAGDADPALAPAPGRPGRRRRRGERRASLAGAHRRPLRADPHLQLPGEPDLRPPHRLQVLQPRPGARRRPRSRCSTRASRPTWPPAWRRWSPDAREPAPGAGAAACCARPVSPRPSATPTCCSPTSSTSRWAGCRWSTTSTADQQEHVRRPAGAPGRPRAAAAPDRLRGLPPRRARGRVRASSCPAPRPSCWPAGRSTRPARPSTRTATCRVVDLCTGSGAIARAIADEVPARRDPRGRARRGRSGVGRAQPRRNRRRPAPRRPGHGLRRPARHRRRGGVQPALHPARGVGVGGRGGARPRPPPRPLLRPGRARRDARPRAPRGAAAAPRGSGRRRARGRPGRVGARRLRRLRPLGRRRPTTATSRVGRAT